MVLIMVLLFISMTIGLYLFILGLLDEDLLWAVFGIIILCINVTGFAMGLSKISQQETQFEQACKDQGGTIIVDQCYKADNLERINIDTP